MRRVAKNVGFLLMTHGVSLAAGIVVLALSARYLGPALFGEQAVLRSVAHIALPLLTGGLRVNMAKEIGRDPEGAASYLGSVLTLRWLMAAVVAAAAVAVVLALPLTPARERAAYAMVLMLLAGMWGAVASAVFVAYERNEYNLAMSTANGLLIVPLTMLAIRLDAGVAGILAAAAVGPFVTAQIAFSFACRRFVRPKLAVDLVRWRQILRASLPLGVGAMLKRSYARVDVFLLAALQSAEAAGIFSVAYRAAIQFTSASTTVGTAILPRLSLLARRAMEQLRAALEHLLLIFLAVSVPAAGMIAAFAAPLLTLVVGAEFASSIAALRLISIAIVTAAPDALLFFCLVALGREAVAVRYLALSVIANVVLDVLLIPLLGVSGACLGTIGAEWIFFSLSLVALHRALKLTVVWRSLLKIAASGVAMGLVIYVAGPERPVIAAGFGLAAFLLLFVLSRAFPPGGIRALRRALIPPPPTVQH
jgi:O-antigen/teichoic acid export membrane protein